MKDILFLLPPEFPDPLAGPGFFYCPDCAAVRGLLAYFPKLSEELDVRVVEFEKPRSQIMELLGQQHQGCPVIVIDDNRPTPKGIQVQVSSHGKRFVPGAIAIGKYLAAVYSISRPHP
jgi:uncharacterized protein (DUF2249 family)